MKIKKLNEARKPDNIKITVAKGTTKWISDTLKGFNIILNVNGKELDFSLYGCYGSNVKYGADTDSVRIDGKYMGNILVSGGRRKSYALYIPEDVLTSEPKENQKDFSFIGQLYNTRPAIKYFKDLLKDLLLNHKDYFAPKFLDAIGLNNEEQLNESTNLTDEFYDIIDTVIGPAINSIGGDMDDITGDIAQTYDEDKFFVSLYSTVPRKLANKFSKNFLNTIQTALSKTRFSDVSLDSDRTFAYRLSRMDIHNHLGSESGDRFMNEFAMFEIGITAYADKLQESMTIGYDQASIDNQIKVLEKNIKDYEQLIIDEPEDKDYWQEMIDKCKEDIEDLKSYSPLQESNDDADENYKIVSIAFDVEAPSNMKESDIENVIRRAIDGTDLFVSSYMEVHTLSESLKTRSTYRCDENFSLKNVKKG